MAGMNFQQIETFVHVAEHGSFSKAALVLGSQPALSRQVRALETELRETLLLRNGRGVSLTEAGRRLLEHGLSWPWWPMPRRRICRRTATSPSAASPLAMPPTQARVLTLPLIQHFQAELPQARLAVMEGFLDPHHRVAADGRCDRP